MQSRWKREQIPDAMRQQQRRLSAVWRKHRSAMRFVMQHQPQAWERIKTCGMCFDDPRQDLLTGLCKLKPYSCHQIPWCLRCTAIARYRRTRDAFDKFSKCTPAGKPPRFVHIVQTAPLTKGGEGWGWQASHNVPGFRRAVFESLKETYGDGIGAFMSYQDFGEEGFVKRHPHQDFTLNGWAIQDGKAVKLPRVVLYGDGKKRFDDRIVKHAQKIAIGAQQGNVKFQNPIDRVAPYWRIMRYQVREMVDLRKLTYDGKRVGWKNYDTEGRAYCTPDEWLDALAEYQKRLVPWGSGGPGLHKAMGHMSSRNLRATQKITRGTKMRCRPGCACGDCGEWLPDDMTEEEQAISDAGVLRPRRPFERP